MRYNILKNLSFLFFTLALSISFVSCEKVESVPDESDIVAEDMMGSWYVQFLYEGEDLYGEYLLINTYNTSANDGTSMWIDDNENVWWFKVECPINSSGQTFSGAGLYSNVDGYEIDVDIINGKITKDGVTSPSGVTTDMISFDIEFSDDAGTVYQIVGYRYTGLVGDQP
uniref:lipid-binding protein n=1 Tax=uncultured Draconibacterium sp. TaxID=1573823 RepID=UPI003217DCFA